MSMEAVSGDIFSILRRFATPTMGGTYTNSNAPRPMPPKAKAEANTDAARAQSDPTRYGATGSDAGTGLVPQPPSSQLAPPQPVATRVVPGRPPPPAARPPAAAVQPDVEATGAIPPPGDGSRATALVNAPDGQVPAGAPAATGAAPGEFDFITQSPLYRFMKIEQAKKKAEADRQRSMDNIFFGLSKAVGGFTGTPVETGQAGARGGNVSADPTLTFDNLKDLQAQQQAAVAEAEDLRRMTRILADPNMKGLSRDMLMSIKANDPKKYAELLKDYSSGESVTWVDPTSGAILSKPKHGDPTAPPTVIYESPWTERKAAIEQEKGLTEIEKGRQTLVGKDINDPAVLRMIAIASGRNPDDPAVQAWVRAMPAVDKQKALDAAGGTAGGFAVERQKKLFGDGAKLGVIGEGKAAIEGSIATNEALQRLRQGEGWTGAIGGNAGVRWIAKIAGDLGISTALSEGATQTEINESLARVGKAAKSKLFGTNPSDAEQKALDALTGVDQQLQRDALIFINQRLLRQNVRTALQTQAEMESAKKDFAATPHAAAAIGTLDVPDYTEEIFPKAPDGTSERDTVYQVADVATQHAGNPEAQKQLEQHRAAFDKAHGKGMFDYVLQHRPAQ